ncbi:MAG: alpha-E domain-containing protein, partial [Betaproteobacteria bacterium]|nr:alpha-E domain-containing protein [Betaproteobacteria bacterium]
MLSRTASHLYWMARYVERAENTARMLDVAGHNALLPTARTNEERDWAAPLLITGRHDAYKAEGREINAADVTAYMALDPENPASIHACLYAARENARAVRSTITSEMWEVVNTTWLGLREFDSKVLKFRGSSAFLAWV